MEEAPSQGTRRARHESEIRPRPGGGAGDRARRVLERRDPVAVGIRAARRPAGVRRAERPAGAGVDCRAGDRPAPAPVGAAGPVRRLLRRRASRATSPPRTSPSTIVPGGPDVIPQAVGSQPDGPEFTISLGAEGPRGPRGRLGPRRHRPGLPALRHPVGLVEGQRHHDPCKFAGKKVGVWDFGNEFEVTAGALACGLTPGLENSGDPASSSRRSSSRST